MHRGGAKASIYVTPISATCAVSVANEVMPSDLNTLPAAGVTSDCFRVGFY